MKKWGLLGLGLLIVFVAAFVITVRCSGIASAQVNVDELVDLFGDRQGRMATVVLRNDQWLFVTQSPTSAVLEPSSVELRCAPELIGTRAAGRFVYAAVQCNGAISTYVFEVNGDFDAAPAKVYIPILRWEND